MDAEPAAFTIGELARQTGCKIPTIRYYEANRRWMHYDVYLAAGYPIGSGAAEGACRHLVKDRMEGAGMRWSVPGADAVLKLRAVALNGDWDAYWQFHMQREAERRGHPGSLVGDHGAQADQESHGSRGARHDSARARFRHRSRLLRALRPRLERLGEPLTRRPTPGRSARAPT